MPLKCIIYSVQKANPNEHTRHHTHWCGVYTVCMPTHSHTKSCIYAQVYSMHTVQKTHKDNKMSYPLFFPAFACIQAQINTATSSLKCTSLPCFPLPGSVPVRTVAQNSQSAGLAGDGLSPTQTTSPPGWKCVYCICTTTLHCLPHSPQPKQKLQRSCSYSMWALCKFWKSAALFGSVCWCAASSGVLLYGEVK